MMKTERLTVDTSCSDLSTIKHIAESFEHGNIGIYPTETIYGIGGRFDVPDVAHKIISAKGRSQDQPMILIAASIHYFDALEITLPRAAVKCAEAFWPGLLTMVLPSPHSAQGIGIRVSNHPVIVALSRYFPTPLYSTSANKSGISYNPDPDEIFTAMNGSVDFMADYGPLPPSSPSTVIRITSDNAVTVLREGCIAAEQILSIAG